MARILIAEDHSEMRQLIRACLTPEYEVLVAENGQEVIRKALAERPDLILVDVRMPIIDGLQAIRMLKDDNRTAAIPVIIVSAMNSDEEVIAGLNAGADDYICKPFNVEVLKALVNARLRSNISLSSMDWGKRERDIVFEITQKATSTLALPAVLHIITRKISDYLNLYRCSIVLVEEDKGRGLVMASNDDPDIGGLCISLDKYPEINTVLDTMEPLVIDDIKSSPIMQQVRAAIALPFTSLLVIPIIFRDTIIGTLMLRASRSGNGFSESEISLCRLIANSSANAIKNAYLYQKLEEEHADAQRINRRLKELDRLKNKFMVMASHELKTPLSIVNGYLEMLLDGVAGPLNTQQLEMVNLSLEASTSLTAIVAEMLDINVIDTGHVTLHLGKHSITEVIRKVLIFCQKEARDKGIRIEIPKVEITGTFDRKRVMQIMINLITNAIKYTSSGGEIMVTVEDGAEGITVTVADNGKGIPENDIERVFEEFYRGEGNEYGSGLGLSISKRIVSLHGGEIWVDSREGKGSAFHFTLPRNPMAR